MPLRYTRRALSDQRFRDEKLRFEHYRSERGKFEQTAKESWELFHNAVDGTDTQYTVAQLDELQQNAAPDVSMNFMYPILMQQKALLTSDAPMGRVLAEGGEEDKPKAYIYDKLCSAIWRRSKAGGAFDKAVKEMLVCGISALIVEPSSFYRPGMFDLTIDHVSWENIFIDPDAKETGRGFRDAESIIIASRIPTRKAKNIYGYAPEEDRGDLEPVIFDRTEEVKNPDILLRRIYEKRFGVYLVGQAVISEIGVDGNELLVTHSVRKVYQSAPDYDINRLMERWKKEIGATELLLLDAKPGVYVNYEIILGNRIQLYNEMLPLTEYPLAFFTPDDYNSPYIPSPASFLRAAQHAMNKFYQIVIVNALLSSNTRFIAPEGAITDKNEFLRNISAAGGVAEYLADETLPGNGKPESIPPAQLANAFYTMAFDMKSFMEYNSGMFGITQGDPSNAPDVYSSLQSLQNHSTIRSKNMRGRIERAISYMWKAAMEYIQYFGDRSQIMRYLDDFNVEQEVDFSEILEDSRIITYDLQTTVKTAFPTDRQEMVNLFRTALGQISDPQFQKFGFRTMLEMMDYPVTDELLKKMDINDQLSQQIEQMKEQLNEADELIKELSQEVIVKEKKAMLAKFESDLDGISNKAEAKASLALGKLEQGGSQPGTDEV
jgi:hypothetical protein